MITYNQMTVGSLINWLSNQPFDMVLNGLSDDTDSYRGYYQHVAIEPGNGVTVEFLLDELNTKVGTVMQGYKGGEFPYNRDCYVFVAYYGDCGPSLIGFQGNEPVVVEDIW